MSDSHFENLLTIVTPEGVQLDLVVAGVGSRVAARAIDSVIQGVAIIASLVVFFAASADDTLFSSGFAAAAMFAFAFVILFLYDVICELLLKGQTVGKRAAGLRVVDASGAPAAPISIIVRNIVRIIDFLPSGYLIGLVSMIVSEKTQRLGDFAAHTIVIRERKGNASAATQSFQAVRLTTPPEVVALWDVSRVTAQELMLCRQFLSRRFAVPSNVRYSLSVDIANRLAPNVSGLPAACHPEFVIEGVVMAKEMRS